MNPIATASLFYAEGRSDKEYHAEIVAVAHGNVVNFRYGRRGASLTFGTKTSTPVDLGQAQRIFDKLIKEKIAKGYTTCASGSPYQDTEHAGTPSGFQPQLLNPLTTEDALHLIEDDRWAVQEKMDGERRAVLSKDRQISGANRKGLIVPLPQAMADELQTLAEMGGDLLLDGEIIGDILYVFDCHVHKGQRIHTWPWRERMRLIEDTLALANFRQLKAIPVAVTPDEKRSLWHKVQSANGEGLVFKRQDAPFTAGRPNTGGDWLKLKFTESASCCVLDANPGKRSVRIGLLDRRAAGIKEATRQKSMIPVGNVTIPPNHDVPVAGEVVEVGYLYAYPGGSLYQPVYRGKRMDLDSSACTLAQLKYKPAGREAA